MAERLTDPTCNMYLKSYIATVVWRDRKVRSTYLYSSRKQSSYTGHKISTGYVMLDSRITLVKPRKRSTLGQQLQTGEFCCLFPTDSSHRKHDLHCSRTKTLSRKFSRLLFVYCLWLPRMTYHKGINASQLSRTKEAWHIPVA